MKVLHIFNEINFSGAEIMYANAAPLFQKSGYELMAIATGERPGNYESEFIRNGISIVHKPIRSSFKGPLFYVQYIRAVNAVIRENKIDIIHIHRASYMTLFAFCGAVHRKKVIRTVHNVFRSRKITWVKAWAERLIARKLLGVTFQTIGDSVSANELFYYKNRSIKINNWYDANRFYPATGQAEKAAVRSKLGLPENKFLLISVGACTPIKNHGDIIAALSLINKWKEYFYVHLGKGETEGQEKEAAATYNIEGDILFAGNRSDVRDFLIASDLFVMTSKFEGLSISSIEAMACGLPLLLYDSPGLRDMIHENDCGFLIDKKVELLADTIQAAQKHPVLLKSKVTAGVNKVKSYYSMEKSVLDIIYLYQQ